MPDHDAPLDAALRQHLQNDAEPDDAGFSLGVRAALPLQVAPARWRHSRGITLMQWTLSTGAACGAAALMGLLIYWSIPSRWNRG